MRDKIVGLGIGVIFTALLTVCSLIETRYTREAVVVSYRADAVVVQCETGHEWGFIGTGYELGEKVTLVMDNNHTMSVEDDRIVKVK
ncbi:MAG: hypothetical protein J6V44_17935 [Methanobrevibacter sp.]|nr:hypothetical protein [Methanobrevibacter sp.]